MKTTNSAQKTENRPFGKSTIFISSLVLSLVLLGFTTSAKGVGKHFPEHDSKRIHISRVSLMKRKDGYDEMHCIKQAER